jgi:lipoprotein-releasing system permease protein
MPFSFFISKRYILSKKDSRFINLISTISIIGIAIGVATLIIALSILAGFERTLTNKLMDFDSHIQIASYRSKLPDYQVYMPKIISIVEPNLKSIVPYVSKLAIISSKKRKEGVNIKGVLRDADLSVKNDLVSGEFILADSDSIKTIIIGKKLANKLAVKTGDMVTIFALKKDEIPSPENFPSIEQFKVSGIFESGMAKYDDLYAYVNLNAARRLFDLENNINGYDIRLKDISKIDSLTNILSKTLRFPHYARSVYQTHRNIFTWIDLQKKPIPIVLGLIIVVAVINIISTLLMIVLDRTNAVGVLRSLGARRIQIIRIFLIQGLSIALIGILSGNLLAYVLMKLQLDYKIISIPSDVYFMSSVPVHLTQFSFILVSFITLILCVIASLIPAIVASRIQPINALRFS